MEFAHKFEFCCVQVVLLLTGFPFRVSCEQDQTAQNSLKMEAETPVPATVQEGEASTNLSQQQIRTQYQMFIKILSRHCARHYSGSCLKLDVLRIMNSLHNSDSYQILPGISLKFEKTAKNQVPLEIVRSIAQENETAEFDKYFYEKIKSQLNSASIHFRLFDDNPAQGKTLDSSLWSDLYKTIRGKKGRKKNPGMKNALKNAGLVAGSTLLVMAMKTIMAFSVKAFMAAMLSLVMSAMSMRGKGGHGGAYTHGSTTYEIIAKPMISHTSSIAVEPHVESVSESQTTDHYRRAQYFDALDYEPQYGIPRPVPIPISHYSGAHPGIVYHAQVNSVN